MSDSPYIAVPTRGRQALLERLLSSLPRSCQVTVVHDGEERAASPPDGDRDLELAGREVRHINGRQKKRFITKIVDAIGSKLTADAADALSFTLTPSHGGNRNAIQLIHAGKQYLSIDDDCLFSFYAYDDASPTKDAGVLTAYADDERALRKHVRPYEGNPLRELLAPITDPIEQRLRPFSAMAGVFGGRWFSRPHAVLFASPELRRFSYQNRSRYRRMRRAPLGITQASRYTVSRSGYFIAGCSSIDATRLLPPYPPLIRPEDSFWATLAVGVKAESGIAQLPFAAYHDPPNRNPFSEEELGTVAVDFGLLAYLILKDRLKALPLCESETGLTMMGKRFIELSELGAKDWEEYCYTLSLDYVSQTVHHAREQLEFYRRKPRWWARDMDSFITQAVRQSMDPGLLSFQLENQSYFREYGQLLLSWPTIWKAAVEVNQSGEGELS